MKLPSDIDLSAEICVEIKVSDAILLGSKLDSLADGMEAQGRNAEKQALWNLACAIEKSDKLAFRDDWNELLEAAHRLHQRDNE